MERLRDLVRRSLLARICLANGGTPLWPLTNDEGVDAAMANDTHRTVWRATWRDTLASFDALDAAERPLRQVQRSGVVYSHDHEQRET